MTPKNIHKIFTPQNLLFFYENSQKIEIQNFEPNKMVRAYICVKLSEYPNPLGYANAKVLVLEVR